MGIFNDLFGNSPKKLEKPVGPTGMGSNNLNPSPKSEPEQRPRKIDLSQGPYELEAGETKHDLYNQLRGMVKDPGVRSEITDALWDNRGNGGVKRYEIKQRLQELEDKNIISNWQHRRYKKDLGIFK